MKTVIVKADKSNKEWKWMAVCPEHGWSIAGQTKKGVQSFETKEFCDGCNEEGA
jgi:hypothetical protein